MSPHALAKPTLASLPPPWSGEALLSIRKTLRASPRKVVVLDDDPTGTQTVEDISVVTQWDLTTLEETFAEPEPGFFILTNSRALSEAATISLHQEILANLKTAANGIPFTVISRSDSTLRGHFLAEANAISDSIGPFDLTVIAPFFEAGQRLTLGDTHYLIDQGELIPVHETPFAQDKVFGYSHSYLPDWIEEKTHGKTQAQDVVSISLDTIRNEGPEGVLKILEHAKSGSLCIVNACAQRDMEVFAAAVLRYEESGKKVLYRTAAAFVAARLGQRPPPPLLSEFIANRKDHGGLIVVGSYVPKSSEQLVQLREQNDIVPIELDVATLLDSSSQAAYLARISEQLATTLATGQDLGLFTSRQLVFTEDREANLDLGGKVANALVAIVSSLKESPGFVIAKGGITSSTIATDALKIKKATIIGQLIPGVPVWRANDQARFPQIDLVIFPGNVGGPDALSDAYKKLKRVR